MVSCRRHDELAPEVFVVMFASPSGLIDALDEFKLFCAHMILRSSSSTFLLSTVISDVTNLVTVEPLLELVGTRLGIKLVPVIFGLRLPLALLAFSFFTLAILAFSALALEHRVIHWHNIILAAGPGNGRHLSSHLIEGVESARMESLPAWNTASRTCQSRTPRSVPRTS